MSIANQILKSVVLQMSKLLDEDQNLHFRKIHKPIDDMSDEQLLKAIQLVENTLKNSGVNMVYLTPTIKSGKDIDGYLG